jgi:hypothetical protein
MIYIYIYSVAWRGVAWVDDFYFFTTHFAKHMQNDDFYFFYITFSKTYAKWCFYLFTSLSANICKISKTKQNNKP